MMSRLHALSNLQKRVLSSLVLIPPILGALWAGSPYRDILLVTLLAACSMEWFTLVRTARPDSRRRLFWFVVGFSYILPAFWGLYTLMQHPHVLWSVLLCVWASDTGAYFVGRAVKGPKLAPAISPGKTWSGAVGGLLLAMVVGYGFGFALNGLKSGPLSVGYMIEGFYIAIIAQLGDLLESLAKRHLGVKDSGQLIPGHGGILDRLDSLLAIGLMAYFLQVLG